LRVQLAPDVVLVRGSATGEVLVCDLATERSEGGVTIVIIIIIIIIIIIASMPCRQHQHHLRLCFFLLLEHLTSSHC
jgi:hypothetical protein